jgi:poly(3-hydroxybutyrate) depolymerase
MRARLRTLVLSALLGSIPACSSDADSPNSAPAAGQGGTASAGKSANGAGGPAAGSGGTVPVTDATQPPPPWPSHEAACTGKPGSVRGKSTQMLMAARLLRSFIYYAPASLDPNKPVPVVIVPHGYTMNADQMFDITRYSDIADREQLIVMFPNGQPSTSVLSGPWNVGNPDCASSLGLLPLASGDDQAFINEMVHFADTDQCIDPQHVYVTGFSMGGYFANETGCLRTEVRAIAPHSGGTHDLGSCKSEHKPVLLMHFQGDGLIPYECGHKARDRWVAKNGCQLAAPDVKIVMGGSCEYYKGCPADGQVGFCSFMIPSGGNDSFPGHAWSGGSEGGMGAQFAIPQTESASELSWSFFKQYAW